MAPVRVDDSENTTLLNWVIWTVISVGSVTIVWTIWTICACCQQRKGKRAMPDDPTSGDIAKTTQQDDGQLNESMEKLGKKQVKGGGGAGSMMSTSHSDKSFKTVYVMQLAKRQQQRKGTTPNAEVEKSHMTSEMLKSRMVPNRNDSETQPKRSPVADSTKRDIDQSARSISAMTSQRATTAISHESIASKSTKSGVSNQQPMISQGLYKSSGQQQQPVTISQRSVSIVPSSATRSSGNPGGSVSIQKSRATTRAVSKSKMPAAVLLATVVLGLLVTPGLAHGKGKFLGKSVNTDMADFSLILCHVKEGEHASGAFSIWENVKQWPIKPNGMHGRVVDVRSIADNITSNASTVNASSPSMFKNELERVWQNSMVLPITMTMTECRSEIKSVCSNVSTLFFDGRPQVPEVLIGVIVIWSNKTYDNNSVWLQQREPGFENGTNVKDDRPTTDIDVYIEISDSDTDPTSTLDSSPKSTATSTSPSTTALKTTSNSTSDSTSTSTSTSTSVDPSGKRRMIVMSKQATFTNGTFTDNLLVAIRQLLSQCELDAFEECYVDLKTSKCRAKITYDHHAIDDRYCWNRSETTDHDCVKDTGICAVTRSKSLALMITTCVFLCFTGICMISVCFRQTMEFVQKKRQHWQELEDKGWFFPKKSTGQLPKKSGGPGGKTTVAPDTKVVKGVKQSKKK